MDDGGVPEKGDRCIGWSNRCKENHWQHATWTENELLGVDPEHRLEYSRNTSHELMVETAGPGGCLAEVV